MTASIHSPDAPILIFDSGIGGLSVLGPIRALLPLAPIVYAADYAAMPYGTKSEAEIAARVPALLGRLVERFRPRIAVIACNTASTIALDHVRAALDIPVVGTVPAIKPAAALSQSRVIGVLGTEATVRQPYVERLARDFAADATILRHGSADLVLAAEAKLRGETPDAAIFADAMAGLTEQPGGDVMDVVVLSCTHFPLVIDELRAAVGRDMHFIDGGEGIARRVAYLTRDQVWPAAASEGRVVFTRLDNAQRHYSAALATYGLGAPQLL
ncbi:glutamate racemase [Sphingorhabdus soli]|uniref:Glutamate racemase n=1 Tax=Flavisphingopyxis soli TaxID=2601267 RepID=A0A5C6U8M5_9SPHN|nr:glutamate racemase [Sphingorhabdus soli]TXC69124.1 glutamate racemase [Sphingorhabdus soli]